MHEGWSAEVPPTYVCNPQFTNHSSEEWQLRAPKRRGAINPRLIMTSLFGTCGTNDIVRGGMRDGVSTARSHPQELTLYILKIKLHHKSCGLCRCRKLQPRVTTEFREGAAAVCGAGAPFPIKPNMHKANAGSWLTLSWINSRKFR